MLINIQITDCFFAKVHVDGDAVHIKIHFKDMLITELQVKKFKLKVLYPNVCESVS